VPKSALIVKLAAIGDVVMALPIVTALRACDPAVRITWLCGKSAAPLLRCVDAIDEVVEIDDAAILAGVRTRQMREVAAAYKRLRGRRYDLALIAHSDSRYRVLAAGARAGETRWLGRRGRRPGLVPGRYHGDEYVRMVTGVDDSGASAFDPPRRAPAATPGTPI